ncbi:MAG: glycosyltransferase [Lautropia sp.]|nr:glycosyltransferase [Lautropia sp.]
MKPIPVCHVSTVHRGVEIRIIRKELASLAQAGYEAHAIIGATPEEVAEAAQLDVTIHPLVERPGSGRLSRMTRKMFDAWQACRRLDARLYHFHDPELIPLGMLLKLFGYRVVMDVHEDLANQILTKHWIPTPLRRLVARISRGAERLGSRVFDGVVTASPRQAAFFQDVGRRVITAHNFPLMSELAIEPAASSAPLSASADASVNEPSAAAHPAPTDTFASATAPAGTSAPASAAANTPAHPAPHAPQPSAQVTPPPEAAAPASPPANLEQPPRTHVVYVGGISRIRGINEAVQAIELADVRLILAGKFKTDAEKQEAAALPGWSRVEYLGWVDRDGIRNALARSFAGLCTLYPVPNHLNAEPIKLFEYMAAGIPSIVSTIPDWMPYVEKHDAGLCVDPMDIEAIAEAIRFLRDNPERARQMGENGRRAVLEHYNWDTQAERLKQLYHEILAA